MPRGDCGLMCQVRLSINFFAASTTYCSASSLESNFSGIPSTLKNLIKCSTVVVLNLRFPGPVSRSRRLKDFKLDHLTLIFLMLHVLQLLFRSGHRRHLTFKPLLSGASVSVAVAYPQGAHAQRLIAKRKLSAAQRPSFRRK